MKENVVWLRITPLRALLTLRYKFVKSLHGSNATVVT